MFFSRSLSNHRFLWALRPRFSVDTRNHYPYLFNHDGIVDNFVLCSRSMTTDHQVPNILQPVSKSSSTTLRVKKISQAMKAYLERASAHEKFITVKSEEFEIGKQHLANMMGLEAASMTQDDIDKAIRYLLPSGLYDSKARPMMKPPEELYPREKAAQFDESGRPFSAFFYTNKANFYQSMHEVVALFNELDALEDKMIRKGISEVPKEKIVDLTGSEWLKIDDMKKVFLENITEDEYNFLIVTLTRLSQHPYAFKCVDFIWKFRKDFPDVSNLDEVPPLKIGDDGRPYAEYGSKKHLVTSFVKVTGDGNGKITINGKDIGFFVYLQEREQLMFPLEISGLLERVDVEATVEGEGRVTQANTIRHALSMCLRSFVSDETRERMRIAGLLTQDQRSRERKKPGQKGARAKYKWRKR